MSAHCHLTSHCHLRGAVGAGGSSHMGIFLHGVKTKEFFFNDVSRFLFYFILFFYCSGFCHTLK